MELNFTESNLSEFITDYMIKNYLADTGNTYPVKSCKVNKQFRSAVVEFSSLEETNRLALVKQIMMVNNVVGVSKIGETNYLT